VFALKAFGGHWDGSVCWSARGIKIEKKKEKKKPDKSYHMYILEWDVMHRCPDRITLLMSYTQSVTLLT